MKKLLYLFILLFSFSFARAQSGPGGVGNSTNLVLWLNADSISAIDGTPISEWDDISTQDNDAVQANISSQPIFHVDSVNSHNTVSFDGIDDFMNFNSHITTDDAAIYIVFNNATSSTTVSRFALTTENHYFSSRYVTQKTALVYNGSTYNIADFVDQKMEITSGQTAGNDDLVRTSRRGETRTYTNRNSLNNNSQTLLGALYNGTSASNFHWGSISEVVMLNDTLNIVERAILMNSLTAKYGSNMTNSPDYYLYQNNFSHDVLGIGQLNGYSQTNAIGSGVLRILNPDNIDDGEFLFTGHNNAALDTTQSDVPNGFKSRMQRVWRADKTGEPGDVDLQFYIDASSTPNPSLTYVLIDDDGDFSNGGTQFHEFGRTINAQDGYISFSNVSLTDDSYYTLGTYDASNVIHSVQSGNWDLSSTWDCSCIPELTSIVMIVDSHVVDLNTEQSVGSLTIEEYATLNLNPNSILHMFDTLNIYGTLNNNESMLTVEGTKDISFHNYRSDALISPTTFYSLEINNPGGLFLNNALWELENSILINEGELVNNGTFTFLSDADLTAQILPSPPNSFTGSGEYIMQRYISSRKAEFVNLASPTTTTINDWDQEVYMSGVNGNDGNARYGRTPTSPIYYSVFTYDNVNQSYITVTDISHNIQAGIGYELFLGDNLVEYTPTELGTIDVHGVPTTGSVSVQVNTGNVLLGNPYQAFIDWSKVSKPTSVPNTYFVMDASTGNYQSYSASTPIPPGQSFWVDGPSGGLRTITFDEDDKVYQNSNTSTFLRKKYSDKDSLIVSLTNNLNPYSHKHVVEISSLSDIGEDYNDISYIPSRLEGVPALYSTVAREINGEERKLIVSAIGSSKDEQTIPLNFTAGMDAEYTLTFENKNNIFNCAVLEDKMRGKFIEIDSDQQYTFFSEKGKFDRFEIHLGKGSTDCIINNNGHTASHRMFEVVKIEGEHYLKYNLGNAKDKIEIKIIDALGRQIRSSQMENIENSGRVRIGSDGLTGIYFIQVTSESGRKFSDKFYF